MGVAQRRFIVTATAVTAQPLWSLRRRTIFIIVSAAGLWALPIAIVYGLSRIL